MKKSELKQIIREAMEELKEENELLKAIDGIKGVMFKLKKALEPIYKKALNKGIVDKFKLSIIPYNGGYKLELEQKSDLYSKIVDKYLPDRKMIEKKLDEHDEIYRIMLSYRNSIYLYGESFFQEYIDKGESARLDGKGFETSKDKNGYDILRNKIFNVKNKNDINKALDYYYKENMERVKYINDLVDKADTFK